MLQNEFIFIKLTLKTTPEKLFYFELVICFTLDALLVIAFIFCFTLDRDIFCYQFQY